MVASAAREVESDSVVAMMGKADQIVKWLQHEGHGALPYRIADHFHLWREQAEAIYSLLPRAFGPGGKGVAWITSKVKKILETSPKKTEKHLYILHVRMTKNEPHIWDQRFAFHATSDSEAKKSADRWAHYQGMVSNDVAVKRVESGEKLPYSVDFIHDEWIPKR